MPGAYAAIATLILVVISGGIAASRRFLRLSLRQLITLAVAIGVLVIVYCAQTSVGLETRWVTLAQLVVCMVASAIVASNTGVGRFLSGLAFSILALNFLLLVSYFTEMRDGLWTALNDTNRYRGYFDEPAEAGIMFGICIAIILTAKWRSRLKLAAVFLYMVLIAASQSLSGILLAAILLGIASARGDLRLRPKRAAAGVYRHTIIPLIGAFAVASGLYAASAFNNESFLRNRISNFAEGGHDGSAQLRLLSPLQIAHEVYVNDRLAFGMGIGGHERYILNNTGDFPLQVIYTGEEVGQINNGYVALIAMLGYPVAGPLAVAAIFLIWLRIRSSPKGAPPYFLALMLVIPFADGRIVSAIYFLVVGLFAGGGRRLATPTAAQRARNQFEASSITVSH